MSLGPTESTTVQKTEYPQWMTDAQKYLGETGGDMLYPFLQQPQYAKAGFNPDQIGAFDLTRGMAQKAFSPGAGNAGGGSFGVPASTQGLKLDTGEINRLMNPYVDTVLNSTLGRMEEQKGRNDAITSGRYGASRSFGGSGEALQRFLGDKEYGKQVGDVTAAIKSGAFDKAAGLAQTDQALQFQAGQNDLNRMLQASGLGLQASQIGNTNANSEQARQLSAIQALLGMGNQQQQFQQSTLNTPWEMLDKLKSITPGQVPSTTTQTTPLNSNPLGTVIGGLLAATSLFGNPFGGLMGGAAAKGLGGLY